MSELVFISEDKQYVLKFFKQKHLRIPFWAKSQLLSYLIKPLQDKKIEKKQQKIKHLFSSCKLAYMDLKEETGLIFVHLNKDQSFDNTIVIKDKIGFEHSINLNEFAFVLQRKVQPAHMVMQNWLDNNEIDEAKKGIADLFKVIQARYAKGIVDQDPALLQNLGFADNRAFIIDLGQFRKKKFSNDYSLDIGKKTTDFYKWLEKRNSILAQYFARDKYNGTFVNLESARRQIEGEGEDRFGEVAANPNLHNLSSCDITSKEWYGYFYIQMPKGKDSEIKVDLDKRQKVNSVSLKPNLLNYTPIYFLLLLISK